MQRWIQHILIGLAIGCVALGAFFLLRSETVFFAAAPYRVIPHENLLLVGDIMLARQVERYMRAEGLDYPFREISGLLASSTYVLGNFEASVPQVHVPTPSMGFQFSVAEDIARSLTSAGITHVGLANNHAHDFGREGYAHAIAVLRDAGMVAHGSPARVAPEDVMLIPLGETILAVVPIYAVVSYPNDAELEDAFAYAEAEGDITIPYIHWGNEYELVHHRGQEAFAQRLIALGADMIVGHHPHVVQDIQVYEGVPVFYSLGNFIFDQYWNAEVRGGLALDVSSHEGSMEVELIPLQSVERSMPGVLKGEARETFLEALALRSDPTLAEGVRSGRLRFLMPVLASEAR